MEKERSATPVRLGVIQKKYHNLSYQGKYTPQNGLKRFFDDCLHTKKANITI